MVKAIYVALPIDSKKPIAYACTVMRDGSSVIYCGFFFSAELPRVWFDQRLSGFGGCRLPARLTTFVVLAPSAGGAALLT